MGRRSGKDGESRYAQSYAKALGRTIKVIRTDQGIERRELAEKAQISYSYLTEIENGNKPPSPSVLGPIAEALGLRMSELTQAAETRMESHQQASTPISSEEEWVQRFASGSAAQRAWSDIVSAQPSRREPSRDLRSAMIELERLLSNMAPEDIERLMDFARRLTR